MVNRACYYKIQDREQRVNQIVIDMLRVDKK